MSNGLVKLLCSLLLFFILTPVCAADYWPLVTQNQQNSTNKSNVGQSFTLSQKVRLKSVTVKATGRGGSYNYTYRLCLTDNINNWLPNCLASTTVTFAPNTQADYSLSFDLTSNDLVLEAGTYYLKMNTSNTSYAGHAYQNTDVYAGGQYFTWTTTPSYTYDGTKDMYFLLKGEDYISGEQLIIASPTGGTSNSSLSNPLYQSFSTSTAFQLTRLDYYSGSYGGNNYQVTNTITPAACAGATLATALNQTYSNTDSWQRFYYSTSTPLQLEKDTIYYYWLTATTTGVKLLYGGTYGIYGSKSGGTCTNNNSYRQQFRIYGVPISAPAASSTENITIIKHNSLPLPIALGVGSLYLVFFSYLIYLWQHQRN